MAKHKNFRPSQHKENTFDFSSLLVYANEEEKAKFQEGLKQHPFSSLLLTKEEQGKKLLERFPSLVPDKKDKLLFRFDKEEERLGKSLEHFAGEFYLLDPSSAAISYYLAPLLPRDFVSMDLCGAPGGKTIALDLRRRDGLYFCNDISYTRAIEITKNADRLGLENLCSFSLDPEKLRLRECFDCVILDAPCSGSGMIRKEPKMALDYSKEKVERLLPLQKDLLEKAYSLLKKDGILAYSTCSLSVEEDEKQIETFLFHHPYMEEIQVPIEEGFIQGLNNHGIHLVPGIYQGEGIYFDLLKKKGGNRYPLTPLALAKGKEDGLPHFAFKDNEYVVTRMMEELVDLPFLSPGRKVFDKSEYAKGTYDHAYCKVASSLPHVSLTRDEAISYASGNELRKEAPEGEVILTFEGYSLGFGKSNQGKIKNYLPKGLRAYLN